MKPFDTVRSNMVFALEYAVSRFIVSVTLKFLNHLSRTKTTWYSLCT